MEDRRLATTLVPIFLSVLAILAVSLRLIARRMNRTSLGLDDWTILIALIFVLAGAASNIIGAVMGNMGSHEIMPNGKRIAMSKIVIQAQTLWAIQWSGAIGEGLTKISILLFYRRIFLGKVFNITNWIVMGLCVVWTISFFLVNFFACPRVVTYWHHPQPKDCIDLVPMFYARLISDIITDAMILVLPWYPVYHLQMSLRQRLIIIGIFLTGGFVIASGIAKTVFVVQATKQEADLSYTQAPGFYWCTIQACAGIISACLPTMRPLVRGKSFESLIDRMRTKFSNSWPASKLSDHSSHSSNPKISDKSSIPAARYGRRSAEGFQPPLVHVGKPMGVSHQCDTSVEATQMSSLDNSTMDGILVKSSITNDLSFV